MNISTAFSHILLPLIEILLCALFGYLGVKARAWCRLTATREKEAIARVVVAAVEQIYRDLHGEDKRNATLAHVTQLLRERGIAISAEEATLLIEAAVAEFNRAFSKDTTAAPTAVNA